MSPTQPFNTSHPITSGSMSLRREGWQILRFNEFMKGGWQILRFNEFMEGGLQILRFNEFMEEGVAYLQVQ